MSDVTSSVRQGTVSSGQAGGLATLLLMPSFYGAVAWGAWLALYELRLIAWDPAPPLADMLYVLVLAFYLIATASWYGGYRAWRERHDMNLLAEVAEPG